MGGWRRAAAAALAMAGCGALAPAALADAVVGVDDNGRLSVAVVARAGGDGAHGIVVEPFTDENRDGWRVRQDALGRPPFSTSGVCDGNFVFNDVVCRGERRSALVTGGDEADVVHVRGAQVSGQTSCAVAAQTAPPILTVDVQLGAGGDRLSFEEDCPAGSTDTRARYSPRFVATGGGGSDTMVGSPNDDQLSGNGEDDTLRGLVGNDTLDGGPNDDTLEGGDGGDVLVGGTGRNGLAGGDGPDRFVAHGGSDRIDGGEGLDTVTYAAAQGPVTIRIQTTGGVSGGAGENDLILPGTEQLIGGPFADSIQGSPADDLLSGLDGGDQLVGGGGGDDIFGGGGPDVLTGASSRTLGLRDGADELHGGIGADDLHGGMGRDELHGDADGDAIDARDGEFDVITCGTGADLLVADLVDPITFDCESVRRFAVDDGPPAVARGPVRVRGRLATVAVSCPRLARVACRGTLTLRPAGRGAPLGRARYVVRLGRRSAITVRLRRGAPARVRAELREPGVSKKGPRSSSELLRVRR